MAAAEDWGWKVRRPPLGEERREVDHCAVPHTLLVHTYDIKWDRVGDGVAAHGFGRQ